MAKKRKPAVGHPLVINATAFTIERVDASQNRVDYIEAPLPKGREPSKGVLALGDLEWSTDLDAWALPGREQKKENTGGVKRVMGPPAKE